MEENVWAVRFDRASAHVGLHLQNDYLVREGRANSYIGHLTTELVPRQGIYSGSRRTALVVKSKAVLCEAANSEYLESSRLNQKRSVEVAADLYLLHYSMKTFLDSRVSRYVKPYCAKSAQKKVAMLKLRQLQRVQKIIRQDSLKIKQELSKCQLVCGK